MKNILKKVGYGISYPFRRIYRDIIDTWKGITKENINELENISQGVTFFGTKKLVIIKETNLKIDIDRMIVMDFLINNIDRHLKGLLIGKSDKEGNICLNIPNKEITKIEIETNIYADKESALYIGIVNAYDFQMFYYVGESGNKCSYEFDSNASISKFIIQSKTTCILNSFTIYFK